MLKVSDFSVLSFKNDLKLMSEEPTLGSLNAVF